jgi:hypothetical protein
MRGSVAAVDDADFRSLHLSYTGTAECRFEGESSDLAVQYRECDAIGCATAGPRAIGPPAVAEKLFLRFLSEGFCSGKTLAKQETRMKTKEKAVWVLADTWILEAGLGGRRRVRMPDVQPRRHWPAPIETCQHCQGLFELPIAA